MRIASTIGATSLAHDGVTYEPDEQGLFEVPQHVGEHLTSFAHWIPEAAAVDQQIAAEADERLDPARHDERIAQLERDRDDMLAMIEELTGRLDALETPEKPASTRRGAGQSGK